MTDIQGPGLADELFLRGKVPMTKAEVRVVSLSKLAPAADSIIYDIGAGTGSVTVEAARLVPYGRVYAAERQQQAVELIKGNLTRFKIGNVELVQGEAPACLAGLPAPDRVFIGGSGGQLERIVAAVRDLLPVGGRIVVNAVTVETAAAGVAVLKRSGCRVEAVTINCSRLKQVGSSHLWQAENPVTVIAGIKED